MSIFIRTGLNKLLNGNNFLRVATVKAQCLYVPPPDSNPQLVREESILKSLVLTDKTYPISIKRLDDIRESPKGWIPRKVPPPKLPFEMKRNHMGRFNIDLQNKRYRGRIQQSTVINHIKGDIHALKDCLRWRFGDKTYIMVDEKSNTLIVSGYHVRSVTTLLLGLGF